MISKYEAKTVAYTNDFHVPELCETGVYWFYPRTHTLCVGSAS